MKKKIIFIAWNKYHSRNKSIAELIGAQNYHIGKNEKNFFLSAISFIPKTYLTIKLLLNEKPEIIFVTNNVWVLPSVVIIFCKLFKIKVVLDSHSSGITGHWFTYPLFLRKLFVNLANLSLVTNEAHAAIVRSWGGNAVVFPDPPILFNLKNNESKIISNNKINICYINTYSFDEPYHEVIRAVENLDNITLFITGNYSDKRIDKDAKNVVHTGFLSMDDYINLLNSIDIIIVLTDREDTFQCGGNEALSLDKPLILSNTKFLISYFENSAVFVNPRDSKSIRNGIEYMVTNLEVYKMRIKELHFTKTILINEKTKEIFEILNI